MNNSDYEALGALRRDDLAFFERYPDREFRLRRAQPCEVTGAAPKGLAIFSILHRHDVNDFWKHQHFPERVSLNTDRTDAEIRELLGVLNA